MKGKNIPYNIFPTISERKLRRPKGKPVFYKLLQSVYSPKKECQDKNIIIIINIISILFKAIYHVTYIVIIFITVFLLKGMLDFYQQIFIAQEDSKSRIQIEPIQIPDDIISVKAKDYFSLINISDFVIDTKVSRDLLIQICNIVEEMKGNMAVSTQAV